MDIEHLNKSQIVLLTLLVSFVTSIATGIVTVSLMDQAPPIVAATVNRVIEKTVETVTAAPAGQPAAAATTVVTKEKTVVVSESEQIAKAIGNVSPSIVHIYTSSEEPAFLGLGVVMDAGGTILTDSAAIDDRAEAIISLPDSTRVRAFVTRRDAEHGSVQQTASGEKADGRGGQSDGRRRSPVRSVRPTAAGDSRTAEGGGESPAGA